MKKFGKLLMRLVLHSRTYYVLSWIAVLGIAAAILYNAWIHFDNYPNSTKPGSQRRDGNDGHCMIDFGGQWLMGRMLYEGHGQRLYLRSQQREVAEAAFPEQDQAPDAEKSDAENLMDWLMGKDAPKGEEEPEHWQLELAPGIGGQLYPPINAFINYPLALFTPHVGYRINQVLNLLFAFAAGLAASRLARGRVWWPIAAGFFLLFPGFSGTINLGQNAALTLAILVWGWLLISRGYSGAGGVVWAFLAFKPVWAASFLFVLLLTRRWKTALSMGATAATIILATVPFVGWHSWMAWFNVARDAVRVYDMDENWIFLSRDLLSIPRRWLLNFEEDAERIPHPLLTAMIGWWSVVAVLEITVRMTCLRKNQAVRATDGAPAAFLLLSAWLLCFHFMYYDMLLASLPVFLLFTEPRRYLIPRFVVLFFVNRRHLGRDLVDFYRPGLATQAPPPVPAIPATHRHIWVLNSLEMTLVLILMLIPSALHLFSIGNPYGTPWETFVLLALWLWCAWKWLRQREGIKEVEGVVSRPAAQAPETLDKATEMPSLSVG